MTTEDDIGSAVVAPLRQRVDFILEACRGKRVLHLGCSDSPYTQQRIADGTILHGMIEKVAAVQYGIDSDVAGVEMLRKAGYQNLVVGNVEEMGRRNPFSEATFDVVVAGEIIEHLSNPGLFLESIKPVLSASRATLLLTTVNAYCAYRFAYSVLTRRESVHPDHVYYFSRRTLTKLLTVHGYDVIDFAFYPVGREHEHSLRGTARILLWIDRVASFINPALADGVMAKCVVGSRLGPRTSDEQA
jgi:2-polyprenyl-3-methyl-5-hydroxy-6-metoxy-1,4-benzoquinol methylase